MSGRWGKNISFFFIVLFGCAIPIRMTGGQKIKDVYNGLLKVKIKRKSEISEEELFIVTQVTLNFNLLNTLKSL